MVFQFCGELKSQNSDIASNLRNRIDTTSNIEIQNGASDYYSYSLMGYAKYGLTGQYVIGKFRFGIDVQAHYNSDGKLREQDWDEFVDYLDKFHFSWGDKRTGLFVKTGSLDWMRLGYADIVDGYSNRTEYPLYKPWGTALSYQKKDFCFDFVITDIKEVIKKNPSPVIFSRAQFSPWGKLKIGATFATDLNEYGQLIDSDGDGYTDEYDHYPYDAAYVTKYDYYYNSYLEITNGDRELADKLFEIQKNDPNVNISDERTEDLMKYGDKRSVSMALGVDLTYPIVRRDRYRIETFSHFAHILDCGWGIALPGIKATVGAKNKVSLSINYRLATDEFLFGFYNYPYHSFRANTEIGENWEKHTPTRKERLEEIKKHNSVVVGLTTAVSNYLTFTSRYQRIWDGNNTENLFYGEVDFNLDFGNKNLSISAFLQEMNFDQLKKLDYPVTGFSASLRFNRVVVGFVRQYPPYTIKLVDGARAGLTSLNLRYNL